MTTKWWCQQKILVFINFFQSIFCTFVSFYFNLFSTLASEAYLEPNWTSTWTQEDFTLQEIWRTSIHLFKVRWKDRLENYFPLMHVMESIQITFSRILIISYKMLIIRGISNGKINELHRQELASLIRVQEKLKTCRSSKLNFSSSCFIADDSHVKTERLHVVVFSKHDILHFWDNVHLFKYYTVKVPQNCCNSFNCSNQACIQVSKFSFALDK